MTPNMGELEKRLSEHGLKVCLIKEKGRSLVAAKDFLPGKISVVVCCF